MAIGKKAKAGKTENKEAAAVGSSNKINIIIIIMLAIVIVGGGAFAAFMVINQMNASKSNSTVSAKTVATETKTIPSLTYELTEFTVNLCDETQPKKYLKAKIYLGYSNKKLSEELKTKDAIVISEVNSILRSKKSTDYDETNLDKMKTEILDKVNSVLEDGKVSDVYFYSILIQ